MLPPKIYVLNNNVCIVRDMAFTICPATFAKKLLCCLGFYLIGRGIWH
jgi:hypothetical protein